MSPTNSGDAGLVRAIGVRGLTASIVNETIGGGIFVLAAIVAATSGRPLASRMLATCSISISSGSVAIDDAMRLTSCRGSAAR